MPPYEEDYINKYKEEVKQQPLTDWEKIDLKKQLEEQGKKIKNLTAEVEELRFTVKQILKIKEKQNYPKGEY